MKGANSITPRRATSKALASSVITATRGSASCEIPVPKTLIVSAAQRLRKSRWSQRPPGRLTRNPRFGRWWRPARTPRRAPPPTRGSRAEAVRRGAWNESASAGESRDALLRLLVGALDHVEPRDAPVEALGHGTDAACADDLHEAGALEHLQVVRDRALREPDVLGELGRRRRPLAQDRDDPEPDVVGERAQLLGLGDDEDVVRLVVRLGEIETVDGCRNIRQPSTVRKCLHVTDERPFRAVRRDHGEPRVRARPCPSRRSPTASSRRTSARRTRSGRC